MTRHLSSALTALLLVAGASRVAGAQALPSVTAPKQAAMRAAAAVNAHTDAETLVEATPPATPAAAPSGAAASAARPPARHAAAKPAAAKRSAAKAAAPVTPRPDGDSAKKVTVSVAERGAKGEVAFSRE